MKMGLNTLIRILVTVITTNFSQASTNMESSMQPNDVIVELSIFCDRDFGAIFQHHRDAIFEFWATQIWDVNMKFKTLPSSNIQFRVVEIVLIKEPSEQPFIENTKTLSNLTELSSVLNSFAIWLYKNEHNFKPFDIAILATGTDFNITSIADMAWSFSKSVCRKNVYWGKHLSVAMDNYKYPLRNDYAFPETGLGKILGAKHDGTGNTCQQSNNNILSNEHHSSRRFFFSKCNDEEIASHIKLADSSCLYNQNVANVDVLANFMESVSPTMEKQCQIATQNLNATAGQEHQQCVYTKCYTLANGTKTFAKTLFPIDNTPCGSNMFCFRGRCLLKGYTIYNTHANLCLHSCNRFASIDQAVLVNCPKWPTPLDRIRIEENGDLGKLLLMPYSTVGGIENGDKCLFIDTSFVVNFKKCSYLDSDTLNHWELLKSSDTETNFLLYHPSTNTCAMAMPNGSVMGSAGCNYLDSKMLWQFVESNMQYPTHLFQTQDVTISKLGGITPSPYENIETTTMCDCLEKPTTYKYFVGVLIGILLTTLSFYGIFIYIQKQKNVNSISNTATPKTSVLFTNDAEDSLLPGI